MKAVTKRTLDERNPEPKPSDIRGDQTIHLVVEGIVLFVREAHKIRGEPLVIIVHIVVHKVPQLHIPLAHFLRLPGPVRKCES